MTTDATRLILWLEDLRLADIPLVGGKSANLGEMIANTQIPVPPGFAITAYAYREFLKHNNLQTVIRDALQGLDTTDVKALRKAGQTIRTAITDATMPPDLITAITDAYATLGARLDLENTDVAIRSSATAEDLPDASFAGQQDTYLNISGIDNVIDATRKCFASLFTDRAISYREDKNFDHFDIAISVAVQQMVRSDKAASGVAFSIDTETGFTNAVYLTGSYGLGEYIVQGTVNPDQWYIFKPTGKIISRKLGNKDKKLVYNPQGGTAEATVPSKDRRHFVLTDDQAEQLAQYVITLEQHYQTPMDIEWAMDGPTNHLYIVQARPETVQTIKDKTQLKTYHLDQTSKLLVEGEAVGRQISAGTTKILFGAHELHKFQPGQILVTDMTDPDWEPIMKQASAIITNKGGRTAHAAIVSRELGITCVIGTENATDVLQDNQAVTVDCSQGIGRVYEGRLEFHKKVVDLKTIPDTKTKIMMNVGIPEKAFDLAQYPHDGVGLARLEFIINSHIQIHPLALIHYDELCKTLEEPDMLQELAHQHNLAYGQAAEKLKRTLQKIDLHVPGHVDKTKYFIEHLTYGIATIAAAFYPKIAIFRNSDLKTREYRNLIGGWLYEPEEPNPMIGYRGCSRYYSPSFAPAFSLECKAFKRVRDEMGLWNVAIMYPFTRTLEEADKTTTIIAKEGLIRHHFQGKPDQQKGLQIYCMAEIPSNIILADKFADRFDGFSIGSNDLTQLVLGIDRDSELLLHLFDERNEAVIRSMKQLIETAHNHKPRVKVGICGQSPSDWLSIRLFLVNAGIDSMSLNPDTIVQARLDVAELEKMTKSEQEKAFEKALAKNQ